MTKPSAAPASGGARVSLPMVAEERSAFEKCVYCPKLCRATCPVSNAEPTETLTPWGKMSSIYFAGRVERPEDGPHGPRGVVDEELASLAWACTDCGACTSRCDHKNPVGGVLGALRTPLRELGVAPEAARAVSARGAARRERVRGVIASLRERLGPRAPRADRRGLLLGCGYPLHHPAEAELAVRVVEALLGEPVELLDGCCGAADRMAGDARTADALASEVRAPGGPIVLDPGCARALAASAGAGEAPTLVVDLAMERLDRLSPAPGEAARYHDPCSLGRGLGRYEEPRRLYEKVRGAAPLEFARSREAADCSGGGGLVPVVRPQTSRAIARERIEQHTHARGPSTETIVTACAGSLTRFRRSGAKAIDLITILAEGLGLAGGPGPSRRSDA